MNIVPRTIVFDESELPILYDYFDTIKPLSSKEWERIKLQATQGFEILDGFLDRLDRQNIHVLVGRKGDKIEVCRIGVIQEYFIKRGMFRGKQYYFNT